MTGPEQHAATVREALHAMRRAGIGFKGELLNPDPAHLALDELVALARLVDGYRAEWIAEGERAEAAEAELRDANAAIDDLLSEKRAAEARADELQRERDEAFDQGWTSGRADIEAADGRAEQARREADQLREKLDRLANVESTWELLQQNDRLRELLNDMAAELEKHATPDRDYANKPMAEHLLARRAALAGVQADNKDSA